MLGKGRKTHEASRRRPVQQAERQSFTYYSSRRANTNARNVYEGRQPDKQRTKKSVAAAGKSLWSKDTVHRLTNIILVVVLAACLISILQIDNNPRIVILNKKTSYALHKESDYRAAVIDSLRGSWFNDNKVTINTASVVDALRRQFPEIYDVSVVLPLVGHRPTVYIELARPALLLRGSAESVVVDVTGRALVKSSPGSSGAGKTLPTVIDESHLRLQVGNIALSSANVAFIEDVVRQFDQQGVAIAKLVLPAAKEELDVYVKGVTYHVKFNLHESTSREQAGTYFAVRQHLIQQGKKVSMPKDYIDVRLVGRAYFK